MEEQMLEKCLNAVRENEPLIHNITNYVTVNDVANVILACGGSPIMADEKEEVEEITSICGGLMINIGTLNERTIESMMLAGKMANELEHKVLLDPVGAGASKLRTNTANQLMNEIQFDVVRGNMSEIKVLANGDGMTKGVDADMSDRVTKEGLDEAVHFAKRCASKFHSIVAITGAIDLVADETTCYCIYNGRREMSRITGTGCQLSGMMTAFITANPKSVLEAAASAVITMGVAGEIASERMTAGDGNATYRNRIIDAIYNMTGKELCERAQYEIR